ncbi:MAG: BMP family ABC transporter substrate-binding protein [Clostridia bacterium]|nr:BMP family ABC transporter substrate-binding protein [Clostridia bacterium]
MFKKIAALVLAAMMLLTAAACFTSCAGGVSADLKIGVILVGDETEGYTKAHMDGIKGAASALGIADSQIIWKYTIPENSACLDAATDLVGQGCSVIISNSYGHQTYMAQAAGDFTDVTFVSMTGDFAAISGLENFKNGFTKVYEARYVSGVVAGMKVKELLDNGTLSKDTQPDSFDADGNVKIGYVGAFNYAEVVSGYTAFFLGLRSVVPNAVMEVQYTNSWFDIDKEAAAAEALIANGCVIIGQHADSTGAPSATQKLLDSGKICYSVGYNIDMLATAPTAALTSPTNNWTAFYTELFEDVNAGKGISRSADVAKGYAEDGVAITTLGPSCAAGTAEKVEETIKGIKDGTIKVFDTSKFTAKGEQGFCTVETDAEGHVTSCKVDMSFIDFSTMTVVYQGEVVECIKDGAFIESTFRSAPYFSIRIDGITEN